MAHFAKIEDQPDGTKIVATVLVIPNDQEHRGQEFINVDLNIPGTWIQCSINTRAGIHLQGKTPLRMNFPSPGSVYDPIKDAFHSKKPTDGEYEFQESTLRWRRARGTFKYASWIFDEQEWQWKSPIPYPTDGKKYKWDEPTVSWKEVTST